MYEIETLSIDRVLNKDHFYGKVIQKWAPKLKIRYFERVLSKILKKG